MSDEFVGEGSDPATLYVEVGEFEEEGLDHCSSLLLAVDPATFTVVFFEEFVICADGDEGRSLGDPGLVRMFCQLADGVFVLDDDEFYMVMVAG